MTALDKLIEAVEAGYMPMDGSAYNLFGDGWLHVFDAYHGSLDAALALHEALLPGWGFHTRSDHDGHYASCLYPELSVTPGCVHRNDSLSRAWLLAILRAYRSVQA